MAARNLDSAKHSAKVDQRWRLRRRFRAALRVDGTVNDEGHLLERTAFNRDWDRVALVERFSRRDDEGGHGPVGRKAQDDTRAVDVEDSTRVGAEPEHQAELTPGLHLDMCLGTITRARVQGDARPLFIDKKKGGAHRDLRRANVHLERLRSGSRLVPAWPNVNRACNADALPFGHVERNAAPLQAEIVREIKSMRKLRLVSTAPVVASVE